MLLAGDLFDGAHGAFLSKWAVPSPGWLEVEAYVDFGAAFQIQAAVGVIKVHHRVLLGGLVVLLADVRLLAVRLAPDELALLYVFQLHNYFLIIGSGPFPNREAIRPQSNAVVNSLFEFYAVLFWGLLVGL